MFNKIKQIVKFLFIKILPINGKRIVFMSYNGMFCDSPQNIYDYFSNCNTNYELIYLVERKYMELLSKKVKCVDIKSFKGFFYYGTAKIIIDNNYGWKSNSLYSNKKIDILYYKLLNNLKYKKNQYVYTFWHGTPLKKMERDQVGLNVFDFECKNTTMILGNKYTYNIMDHLTFNKLNMKLLGTPRNDILFNCDKNSIIELKKELKLPLDKKIILFAPSFRSDSSNVENINKSGINQLSEIHLDKLLNTLNSKFDGEWVLVCRFHYKVSNSINWDLIKKNSDNKIINGNEDDEMSKYLACADILISDVSSCIFDYMHTNNPTFIYFPDIDNYKNNERGLYYDICQLPFPTATKFDELINDIELFDYNKYLNETKKLKQEFGYIDDKNSTVLISKYILNDIKNKR